MGLTVLKNFRLVDEAADTPGALIIQGGIIKKVLPSGLSGRELEDACAKAALVIDGLALSREHAEGGGDSGNLPALMPAFVDLHAHFRDPGFPEKETLESASLAAAAGGYGTVVCMANTLPVIDTAEKALALRRRAEALGLIDLYPALSLTRGMEGKELSGIAGLAPRQAEDSASRYPGPLLLSEDGKDVADEALFSAAFAEGRRLGIPVSCHCDAGGPEAEAAKRSGASRPVWSAIEEIVATRRAIEIGRRAGGRTHIAHVSTKEAADAVRAAKGSWAGLSCEATPHHIALTLDDAAALGAESAGRVNPPLRNEEDRLALIAAILDGTVDAIATDHAPHSEADKAGGAPGFSGLETAFSVCYTTLAAPEGMDGESAGLGRISLKRLSSLMSASPARILGLGDRGRISAGLRADLAVIDTAASWIVEPALFKSRGKNSPFAGRRLRGKLILTIHKGRVVYQ
ncbi:MAG: dihydroorotase [Treponema sp.]|jgi:dihydroorotase|nr:dihydroorotase [Treponema sp.]